MACGCVSITLKGGSAIDPIDITELYDANKYHDWGCVDTADGLTYDIGTKIIIGDGGGTETHFDLRKAGNPVTWRFADEKDGLELNLGAIDEALLDSSTITTIGSVATTGVKVVAGTKAHITSAKNLTISTFNTFVECAAAAVLSLVNPNFVLAGNTTGAGVIEENYEWDFTVLEGTTPIPLCHIEVDDVGGNPITDETTDPQGQIATQTYEANYWTNNTPTPKTPHSFRFYEYDYNTLTPTMAVSSKLAYSQQMTPDPYITKSKTNAGLINAACS